MNLNDDLLTVECIFCGKPFKTLSKRREDCSKCFWERNLTQAEEDLSKAEETYEKHKGDIPLDVLFLMGDGLRFLQNDVDRCKRKLSDILKEEDGV